MDEKQIETKLASVSRGAYWFGIFGRISVFLGCIALFPGAAMIISAGLKGELELDGLAIKLIANSIQPLIYGWLFLLGRDAFEAVEYVLKEIRDTV